MPFTINSLAELLQRGGIVMYPLLLVSVVSLALILERAWFWLGTHRRNRAIRLAHLADALRRADRVATTRLLQGDGSPYGALTRHLLDFGPSDAVALEAVEMQRPRIDRFMGTLSTIITAAPMLGILGTVTGIIQSFNLLGDQSTLTDPRMVSAGIAEALITTAAGLVIALFTLFPYMAFRAQAERALSRMESIIAAAQQGEKALPPAADAASRTASVR